MTDSRINQNLCRLCGCKNENGRSLNDTNSAELLLKVKETFSMLIGSNDPLPNRICIQCEQDVNVYFIKIKRFRMLEKKWRDEVKHSNPTHPYLQIEQYCSEELGRLREKIDAHMVAEPNHNETRDPLDANDMEPIQQNGEAEEPIHQESSCVIDKTPADIEYEQRELEKKRVKSRRQKQKKFAGYIRSRKFRLKYKRRLQNQSEPKVLNPVSVLLDDVGAIPRSELPYKKYRNANLEIISQNEILESRTRANRRTSQPFNYSVVSAQPQVAPKKKLSVGNLVKKEPVIENNNVSGPLKGTSKANTPQVSPHMDTSTGIRPRPRRRINYSEELVDEAFMYEQILHDKQRSQEHRKKEMTKIARQSLNNETIAARPNVPSPANLDSRLRLLEQRNEISIMPVKSRMLSNNSANKFDSNVSIPMKVEPLFNITSSVSVFKPRKNEPTPPRLQISNITSLHSNLLGPPSKRQKISCTYCTKTFSDEKQLAIHNMKHLQIPIHKLDDVQILNPKLRRGRMLNLDDDQYIRCVNCWQLHTNNKSILDHWNNGACLFYCSLCGKSFHDNIKDLKPHFENEHGIKYRSMFLPKSEQTKKEKPDPPKPLTMKINNMVPELLNIKELKLKKPGPKTHKKEVTKTAEPNYLPSGEVVCGICNRKFIHRKAYRSHHTLKHTKRNFKINPVATGEGTKQKADDKAINPIAVASAAGKSSINQKTNIAKHWKKQANEAVMKTVIRKPAKKQVSSNKQRPFKNLAEPMKIGETLVQCTTISRPTTVQNAPDLQVSQDHTVSSTYLTSGTYDDIQIKPEPEQEPEAEAELHQEAEQEHAPSNFPDNYSIDYAELPVQSCNDWMQQQPQSLAPPPPPPLHQYDAWNQNVVDQYIDTSPRLKVKDIHDLQVPDRRYQPIESQNYQQSPVIIPNQNMTGLQIQNVQSYQPHPVQQQPYVDYSCMTSMNTSMNMPNNGMCQTNLYEMHISQGPPPMQSPQLINPVYLLPSNPTHAVQEYHY